MTVLGAILLGWVLLSVPAALATGAALRRIDARLRPVEGPAAVPLPGVPTARMRTVGGHRPAS